MPSAWENRCTKALDPHAALAAQWHSLFQDMVGSAPETVAQFRTALDAEPVLPMGAGMTEEIIVCLRSARDPA